ncbi:MAG: hypothetical protein DYG97_13525 [Ignavibacteria bacterium CHB3]|nr:MAG: hypothetical protein EDM72_14345 [Chlorobiota bacterium]MCE7857537.1 hypothetical protein [Ignavibacteria bacterium CHB3]
MISKDCSSENLAAVMKIVRWIIYLFCSDTIRNELLNNDTVKLIINIQTVKIILTYSFFSKKLLAHLLAKSTIENLFSRAK